MLSSLVLEVVVVVVVVVVVMVVMVMLASVQAGTTRGALDKGGARGVTR